ncbi:AfsR/SARP family transcriptional regulator [Streptomyces sp. 6N223]|uniref:AfsR/SARP family transcriptional regulator n=1 Tax=Streptomyces sp. 6N223 TaxID=3457412 RepID=UPI003FD6ADFF
MGIEFRLLGGIAARVDDREVDLGPARQRLVLAALLVDANLPLAPDQLVDRVWGQKPPQGARGTLRSYLSRLRAALTAAPGCGIERRPGGYAVELDADAVDLHAFRRLLVRARGDDDDARAAGLFARALALWRGEPFADADTPWFAGTRHALHTERHAARLDLNDVRLRLGDHAALLPELDTLARAWPLDERLAGQLILALYRSGRQADALDHYERLRHRLADELGADPSPDLRRLHHDILSGTATAAADPEPPAPPGPAAPIATPAAPAAEVAEATRPPTPAAPAVPRQLPAPPPLFTGRARELAALDAHLAASPGTVVVSAIGGSGGIGKTWLALHWAHRRLEAFPDGQLYVNLRGFDPTDEPLLPTAAVRGFLDVLADDPAAVPTDPDAQAALYRSLVADRRMLILLDNARDSAQVAPLLPGGSSCAVLVTSRHQLPALVAAHGARPLALDTLTPAEGRQLLTRHLGADRLEAEPHAADGLLDHCAGLPLALGIIAARAAMRPGLPLSRLAQELREDATRLDALDAGELAANLRAVFSWSYRALSPQAVRLFRLLSIHPGPDVSHDAAAALLGDTATAVRPLLAELTRAHLITERAPGRFTLHDLLRAYATEQARAHEPDAGRRAALHRLLDHYLHTAHRAATLFDPARTPIGVPAPVPHAGATRLADGRQALAWFTAEHPAVLAAIHRAAASGFDAHAWQLAWTLAHFFFARYGHHHDNLAAQRIAVAAAERLDDRLGLAHSHMGLAGALMYLGHHDDARARFERALALFTALADAHGQARAHQSIGWALDAQGRHREALVHGRHALRLYETTGDRGGIARGLNDLAWTLSLLGESREAIDLCERALGLHRHIDDPRGEATTWDTLAHAHHQLSNHAEAIACYRRALALYDGTGYRYEPAEILLGLGDAHQETGNAQAARHAWQQALDILEALDHPDADRVRDRLGGSAGP